MCPRTKIKRPGENRVNKPSQQCHNLEASRIGTRPFWLREVLDYQLGNEKNTGRNSKSLTSGYPYYLSEAPDSHAEGGAKGCRVVVSGKLRGQRAKAMKFVDGLMSHSGDPVNYYVDNAVHHVLLRQGVLGIKMKILLPWDPSGKIGPKKPLPDHESIVAHHPHLRAE
ncbi:hypothetical protein A6R68_19175, partial [Neotoma lepida]